MTGEKTSCVLRLFGAPPERLQEAVARFPPQWRVEAQWKCRGAETLLALCAATPSGLKKATQSLRTGFAAELYGAGETTLAAAAVEALEQYDRLLVCSDAAAGALLEGRLETIPGAERVFDFGALSYAHPSTGPQIEKRARLKGREDDAAALALARVRAARRVVGAELAAGCADQPDGCVLLLGTKKGCWLRTVSSADNPALWLLDMIRRAAADLPQAEGTRFLPARRPETAVEQAVPPPARKRPRRWLWAACLLLVAAGAAWWYLDSTPPDWEQLAQLPQRLRTQGWSAWQSLWQEQLPKPGATLI